MKLTIKGSQGRVLEVEVDDASTVIDLKRAVEAKDATCPAASLRLIYSGKILADANTLESYGIKDGCALHMVVARTARPAPKPEAAAAAPPQPAPTQDPLPPRPAPEANAGAGGFPGFPGFGGGMPGMPDLSAMLGGQNPAALLQDPMVQRMMEDMMANPQAMADMLRGNPMFANNPMIQELLANPEQMANMMRMSMDMMRGNGGDLLGNAMRAMQENPEMYMNQMRQMFPDIANLGNLGGIFGAPTGPAAPAASAPAAGQESIFQNTEFLTQLLGSAPTPAMLQTINSNERVRQALVNVARGVQELRRNGITALGTVPDATIDTMVRTPARQVAPQPAPAAAAPAPAPQMTPEQRFGPQLQQMNEMGLLDNQRNIEALIATNGNVSAAINWIFSH